ncbi:unnamed protein product [Calypogeia fissa]
METRALGLKWCQFWLQSQAFDGLRAVSTIQHCGVFDGDKDKDKDNDNGRSIGTEVVVSQKVFRMLPEEEKVEGHIHHADAGHGSLSSPGTQEVAAIDGRVVRSMEDNSEDVLPPESSQSLTSSNAGSEKRHVTFLENEPKPQQSTGRSAEGSRPGQEQAENVTNKAPAHLELDTGKEDEYLDDAVHRPVVHHRASHLPALTERLPDDGPFLSETRSTRF